LNLLIAGLLNPLVIGLLLLIAIVVISSLNWRRAVITALVLVVLEGALRKWVLPQASQLIYFLKDFVLLGAYLSYFLNAKHRRRPIAKSSAVNILLFLFTGWGLFQAFNPSLGSPIIGIIGVKNYLVYIPLMWMLPSLFNSEEELYKFLRLYLLLLIPVGLLATAQFFAPPDSPLNIYAWSEGPAVAVFGGSDAAKARVTGTFSYIVGYSVYLGFCISLLLPILTTLKQSRRWQWIAIAEVLLVTVTSFMTGARGLIFSIILLVVSYFGFQALTQFSSFRRSVGKLLLPVLLALIIVPVWFSPAVDAFWLRVVSNQDISTRTVGGFTEPFEFIQYTGLDGYGAGATFQANEKIRDLLSLAPGKRIPVDYEGEMGRIALELGPIGFFAWYGLKIVLLFMLWNVYWQLKRPFLRHFALSIFLFQAITFSSQLVFNHTANVFYWFLNGFIFLLPQLEQLGNWQQYQQQLYLHDQSTYVPGSPYQ
jgi:hypothetical protein